MPIIGQDEAISALQPEATPAMENAPAPQESSPTFGQTLKAAFVTGNTVGSALHYGLPDHEITNPNFDFIGAIKGTDFQNMPDQFVFTNNIQQVHEKMAQIIDENHQNQILQHSGVTGFLSSTAASILDPAFAIPAIGEYAAAAKVGMGIVRTVAAGALSGAAGATGEELGLQATQTTRTAQQSFTNIAATSALSGVLGGAGAAIMSHVDSTMIGAMSNAKQMIENIATTGDPGKIVIPEVGSSAGAAKVQVTTPDASIAYLHPTVPKATQILKQPIITGLTSESPLLRNMTQKLFETNLILNKNKVEGANLPTDISVQTKINNDAHDIYDYQKDIKDMYLQHADVKPGAFEGSRAAMAARADGKMTIDEFNEAGAGAMRRGDISDNSYVEAAAQRSRAAMEPLTKRMQELNILGPDLDLKNDISYFTNVYDSGKILSDRANFENTVAKYYTSLGIDPDEAHSSAMEYTDNVIGLGDNRIALSDIARTAIDKGVPFVKPRTTVVPSTVLEPWLKNDMTQITSSYMAQAHRMIRFKEFLDSEGVNSTQELVMKLKQEYEDNVVKYKAALQAGSIDDTTYNTVTAGLSKNLAKDVNNLTDFTKIMLGQFSIKTKADRALSYLKTYNYLTLMGGFTITAIPHLAAGVFSHGLGPTVMDGLFGSLRILADGARKASIDDLKDSGIGMELETNNTLKSFLDPDFAEGYQSKLDKGINIASDNFSKLAGISHFINASQRMYGNMTRSRIIRNLQNYSTLSDSEKTYMNSIHIGKDDVAPMLAMYDKYGTKIDGGYVANSKQWSDRDAAMKYESAMSTQNHADVPKAGQGDIPALAQKYKLASALFQFNSFYSAVSSKVLLAGLQRRDSNAIQGLSTLLALGSASYIVKSYIKGKEPDMSPQNLLVQGLTRSGSLGLLSRPVFGLLQQAASDKGITRHIFNDDGEAVFGPSTALIKNIGNIGGSVLSGHIDQKTLQSVKSTIPYHNIWYLQSLFKKMNGE